MTDYDPKDKDTVPSEEFVRSLEELTFQPMGKIIVDANTTDDEINTVIENMFKDIEQVKEK